MILTPYEEKSNFRIVQANETFSTELISKYFIHIVFLRILALQSAYCMQQNLLNILIGSLSDRIGGDPNRNQRILSDRISFSDFCGYIL